MNGPSTFRPNRSLVLPFSVVCFPMMWFVVRDLPRRVVDGQRVVTPLVLTAVAFVVSYLLATVVASALTPREPAPTWQSVIFRPTDGALVTLSLLWLILAVYVGLGSIVELPWWSELVVGIPLLWPLLATVLVTYAVGNVAPTLQAFPVEAAFAVVGLSLSAVWIYLLSTGIASAASAAEQLGR